MRYFQLLTTLLLALSMWLVCNGECPPSLVVEPEDTVAGYAGPDQLTLSATLRCQGGNEDSVINWYKDDQPINTTRFPDFDITNGQLTISSDSDNRTLLEGYYFCEVRNALGTVRSRTAWIKGQKLAKFIFPSAVVKRDDEYAIFVQTCFLEYPLPISLGLWTVQCRNDAMTVTCTSVECSFWQHVSPAGRLLVQSVLRIRYSDIQKAFPSCQSASVTVTSFDQEQNYHFSYIDISLVPRSTIKIQTISVKVGDNAILYCISNDPRSVYTWTKTGSAIALNRNSKFSLITEGVLQIEGVTESDTGNYKCTYTFPTTGVFFTRKSLFELTVYSLPTTNLTVVESGLARSDIISCKTSSSSVTECHLMQSIAVHCTCTAEGSKPVTVQLFNNGIELRNESGNISHTINNPQSGIYQCIATNKYGSHQTSMFIRVPDNKMWPSSPGRTETFTTPADTTTSSPIASNTQSNIISSHASMPAASSEVTSTDSIPAQTNSESDSIATLKALAAVGWTFTGLLLGINVVIIIIIWTRHYATGKYKPRSADTEEEMEENPAYNVMPLDHTAGAPRCGRPAEYEDVSQIEL